MTQEELKSLLSYEPETGIFTRKLAIRKFKIGDIAGCCCKTNGYVSIGINGKYYRAHRLAWLYVYGELPPNQIDHINGIKTDNRIVNLRSAKSNENLKNVTKYKNNKSGYKGVSWVSNRNKWVAQATFNGKKVYLGLHISPELAYESYKEFSINNHGEFYCER